MSILEKVKYADKSNSKTSKIKSTYTPYEKRYPTDMSERPIEEPNPDRFKKIPGEKEQAKEMKTNYFEKHKVVNKNITNKQISKLFTQKITILT